MLSANPSTVAFVDDILAEMEPSDRRCVQLRRARTCIAVVGMSRRRRLLMIDGEPPDLTSSALIDAVQMTDPTLPIVLVRYGWERQPVVQDGVHVQPAPLVCRPIHELLIALLAAQPPVRR
ncbi:MAG: hypothetical protein ACXVDD_25545 [Polyangia bacterium]